MARTKLIKFNEIKKSNIVIEHSKDNFTQTKGNWSKLFKNNNPIVLELGCGNGEYTNGLSIMNPHKNYIGVDIKGDRIGTALRFATANNLGNVAYLRTQIQFLEMFFEENEVSEIWITFPDPQPNNSKKRLTSARFLEIYSKIIINNGLVNIKTDDISLFNYSLELLQKTRFDTFTVNEIMCTKDLYNSEYLLLQQGIQTRFELIYLAKNKTIKFLSFKLTKRP
jgi:tRNA (guanine-N7-)-methyltransferase